MSTVLYVLSALFAFFIIVLIHESGHFFVARLFNVKVLQFSIGFGKAIYSRTAKSGVQYALRIFPLGGFVQMADTEATQLGSSGDPLPKHPVWVRFLVVIAGPAVNFILAIFLFVGLYISGVTELKPIVGRVLPNSIAAESAIQKNDQIIQVGKWKTHNWQQVVMAFFMNLNSKSTLPVYVHSIKNNAKSVKLFSMHKWQYNPENPNLLQSLGIVPMRPMIKPIVAQVLARSPANNALESNDQIVSVGGEKITSWQELVAILQGNPDEKLQFVFRRNGKFISKTIRLGSRQVGEKKVGYLGVVPKLPKIPSGMKVDVQYDFWRAWLPALHQTWRLIAFHGVAIKQLVTGGVSLKALGGPISIFKSAGNASQAGLQAYIGFLALISIVIGLLNLLPIPGLDGGHLLFYFVEAVIRRPVPVKIQYFITVLGIGFLILLMTYATFNDLARLFS